MRKMKTFRVFGAVLCLSVCNAQTLFDDFRGTFELPERWGWNVPGNSPENTFEPTFIEFTNDWLKITAQTGTLYEHWNNLRNVPNIPITALRGNWHIETRVQLDRGGATNSYLQAGLVLFRDADNYFNMHLVYDPTQNHWLRISTGHERNGSYNWPGIASPTWNPAGGNTARLLIRHESATGLIHLFYDREDGAFWRSLNGSPLPLSALPALQEMVTQGGRIGLYVDTGGWSGTPEPVAWFDYIEFRQTPLPADVDENGMVNDADLLYVLFDFGRVGACLQSDINHDGRVDDVDLLEVLFNFGDGL